MIDWQDVLESLKLLPGPGLDISYPWFIKSSEILLKDLVRSFVSMLWLLAKIFLLHVFQRFFRNPWKILERSLCSCKLLKDTVKLFTRIFLLSLLCLFVHWLIIVFLTCPFLLFIHPFVHLLPMHTSTAPHSSKQQDSFPSPILTFPQQYSQWDMISVLSYFCACVIKVMQPIMSISGHQGMPHLKSTPPSQELCWWWESPSLNKSCTGPPVSSYFR